VELAVLLECTTSRRSITLAGDTNQGIAPEHGFVSWTEMLERLGLPHACVEPLRISYRSTRQIVDCALHVLGPLMGDERPQVPRLGAEVEGFRFGSSGEACEFLVRILRDLMHREPLSSVALIARHTEQARLYFEALSAAEVPGLRLVADQDFSFRSRHRRDRREADKGTGIRYRDSAGSQPGVVSKYRSRTASPPCGHDSCGTPAVDHIHGIIFAALAGNTAAIAQAANGPL